MSEKAKCEIYLVVDGYGNYAAGCEQDHAEENFQAEIGGGPYRIVKIIASVTPAQIPETELDIPDEAGETKQVEVEAS